MSCASERVNKKITEEVATIPSKRLRNKIAGFTTHLMKRIGKGPLAVQTWPSLRGWTTGGVCSSLGVWEELKVGLCPQARLSPKPSARQTEVLSVASPLSCRLPAAVADLIPPQVLAT